MNDSKTRNKALAALVVALAITIGAWFFIDGATDRGLARLQHIDEVWNVCKAAYAEARTGADTSRIDVRFLSAPIDSGKEGAPHRCGDLRRPADTEIARDSAKRAQAIKSMMPTRDKR